MIDPGWLVVTMFGCFYYLILCAIFSSGAYKRKITLLLDLIPFFGIFRAGIPALFREVRDAAGDLQEAWKSLK